MDAGYRFEFGTTVSVAYTYTDDVIEYDRDNIALTNPSYDLWDLTIRHDFEFGLSATIQGTNLLDENYYQEIGFERPGRNIKLGLQYAF